jgi:starch-binding outer membrane protein, SusD/RagB family
MTWIYNSMNKKIKSAVSFNILLIFILAAISSCMKDVLDKSPTDRFSDAAVWNDKNLVEQFVNNTYRIMPTGNTYGAQILAQQGTDELHGRGGGNTYINQGLATPASPGNNYWTSGSGSNWWLPITNCNIFLLNMETTTISDQAMKDRMTGEIKLIRAFSYFKLANYYGGVPLITKPFALTDNLMLARNTYDEVMNFVITEIDAAIALLPASYPAAQRGRLTKACAMAAKSRALLYMASPLNNPSNSSAKWQAASDAAKAIIDLNTFSLFSDYKALFLLANSYNSEVIWSRPYNYILSNETAYLELSQYPNGYSGYGQVHPYQDFVDSYEMLTGKLPKDEPTYDPQNPYVNRDPRFYATILYNGAPFKGRPVETFLPGGRDSREGPISAWNATETSYYLRKFIDETVTNPGTSVQGNSPFIFFRYAEILLNYAEARYFLGDEPTCRQYINMVRSRPGVNMPAVTESGTALLARLQNERKIELAYEEHRWFDIRRWKIAPIVMNTDATRMDVRKNTTTGVFTYTVQSMYKRSFVDPKHYRVPIPQAEIEKNALLIQNPGYN